MKTQTRFAYVARYPLNASGNDLDEIIIARDTHWSAALDAAFNAAATDRKPSDPMVQGWYSDPQQVLCMATTNQPFKLS